MPSTAAPPSLHALPLVEQARPLLETVRFGRPLLGYDRIESTNVLAAEMAAQGHPEGLVVVADEQTAGRGRLGRSWLADRGTSLMLSVLLRPEMPVDRWGLVPLAGAVAVAETIAPLVGSARTALKWPNDLVVDGKKCGGMLLEAGLPQEGRRPYVILGIGLNVNQESFPSPLDTAAISIRLATGAPVDRAPLLARLLRALEQWYDRLHQHAPSVIETYRTFLSGVGRPVLLRRTATSEPIAGVIKGIAPDGAIRIATPTGLRSFHAGDVTTQH